jgi:hypothetical protein
MAVAAKVASGLGAVTWKASAVSAPLASTAYGVAPRRAACSSDSTTATTEPSP